MPRASAAATGTTPAGRRSAPLGSRESAPRQRGPTYRNQSARNAGEEDEVRDQRRITEPYRRVDRDVGPFACWSFHARRSGDVSV